MTHSYDTVVVGGGIVGASVAYRLATAGLRVGVACGGRPGGGTSGASLAWLNSAEKRPLGYHQLNVAGMAEWRALADDLDLHHHVHFDGSLTWAEDDPGRQALREQVTRLHRWSYPVEVISAAQARRHWAPDLCLDGERVREVVVRPEEGWVETRPVIHALLSRVARARGCRVSLASVVAIHLAGDRVVGVDASDGDRWEAGVVLNCAGPQADVVTRLAGGTLPLCHEPGTLVVTEPLPTLLRPVVHTPLARFRPDGGGRLMLLGKDLMSRGAHCEAEVSALLDAVVPYLPALRGACVEAIRVGVRPMPPDGLPIVGSLPGLEGFYVVVTHSGVTLGPLLGRLVADEVRGEGADGRLAPYRPERFSPDSTG